MSKDFSFPFYINNWIGGVMYYTFEQKGAYLELLLLQFNHGKFTETQVKQVLNTSYSNVWDVIKEKFETDGTFYWNEKMEQVKEDRRLFVQSRRNNRLGKTKLPEVKEDMNNTSKSLEKLVEGESESIDILTYLNEKASKNFNLKVNSNKKFILARLKDYKVEDLKRVIDIKVKEWKGTEHEKFLRPETLFNQTKFESYINQANTPEKTASKVYN